MMQNILWLGLLLRTLLYSSNEGCCNGMVLFSSPSSSSSSPSSSRSVPSWGFIESATIRSSLFKPRSFISSHTALSQQQQQKQIQQQEQPTRRRRRGGDDVPSVEEEEVLLAAAMEYRKIREIETELALRRPSNERIPAFSIPSIMARECGYGDNVHLYEMIRLNGARAREELVTRNMGLVRLVVNDIRRSRPLQSLTKEDLIQEGAIGLARAVDKYQFHRTNGGRFATYAKYWIRASVLRCIAERDDMVRVPENVITAINKVKSAAHQLGLIDTINYSHNNDDPWMRNAAWREAEKARALAIQAGLTHKQVQEALEVDARRSTTVLSFETWMQSIAKNNNNNNNAKKEISQGEDAVLGTMEEEAQHQQRQHMIQVLSPFLRPKEMEALSWRYGLVREEQNNNNSNDEKSNVKGRNMVDDKVQSTTTTTLSSSSSTINDSTEQRQFRDYLAEAEEDLFGPEGILSDYSTEPNNYYYDNEDSIIAATILKKKKMKTKYSNSKEQTHTTTLAGSNGGRWGEAMSFAEVGKHMAISAEYGRRLCSQALDKLRIAAEEGRLEPEWLLG